MNGNRLLPRLYAGLTLAFLAATAVSGSPEGSGHSAVMDSMQPVSLADGRLTGAGGEALLASAAAAQFVLIGEDHGYAEPALVAAAIARAQKPQGLRYLLAEIGPVAARDIEHLARQGDRSAWNAFFRRAPFSVAFLWFAEELELARLMTDGAGESPVIWGIDQEFVLSPALHFAVLRDMAPDTGTRHRMEELLASEREAFQYLIETRDPQNAPLAMYGEAALFAELRERFAGQSEALERIDAMAESRVIYALFGQGRGFENNLQRSALMKRLLRDRLAAAPEGPEKARVLGKFGANHIQRGHTPMGILDIGTFLAERAAWNGTRSYHLLILPVAGAKNMALPFTGLDAESIPVTCDSLGPYAPLCRAAGDIQGWQYVDLEALRPGVGAIAREDRALADLVLGFDAVLYIDQARPATMLAGNRESLQAAPGAPAD